MRNLIFTIVLILDLVIAVQANSDSLYNLYKKFGEFENLKFNIRYEVYINGENSPSETEAGLYIKKGRNTYISQLGSETLLTNDQKFTIDHDAKFAVLQTRSQAILSNSLIDSLFIVSDIEHIEHHINTTNSYFEITYQPTNKYISAKIYYNPNTGYITKNEIKLIDKVETNGENYDILLVTHFFNFSKSNITDKVFDISNYIFNNELITKYSDYVFINDKLANN